MLVCNRFATLCLLFMNQSFSPQTNGGMKRSLPDKPIASYLDYTNLKPTATKEDVLLLCKGALEHKFAAVCVAPVWVKLAAEQLKVHNEANPKQKIGIASVVGFPHGNTLSEVKAFEAKQVVSQGATEVDMVLNISALKLRDTDTVLKDVKGVVDAVGSSAIVKVIMETAYLSTDDISFACKVIEQAGAHYVKTSTGFAGAGALVEHVKLMKECVGDRLGVKAAGGIRTTDDALAMIEAGASRIGCSAALAIIGADGATKSSGY